jgi:hypothetical protein
MVQTRAASSAVSGTANGIIRIPNHEKKMEKTVKLWQAIIATIMLIITVGTAIVNQSTKIEGQRMQIEFLQSISRDQAIQIKDINQQFKEINGKLTDILVTLQNKEDRNKK